MRATLIAAAAAVASATLTYDPAEFVTLGLSREVNAAARVHVTGALPDRNRERLDAILARVSDPKSPEYGRWLSQEQVNELIAPEPAIREEVTSFMTSTGGQCIQWPTSVRCTYTIPQVESLFNMTLTAYHHVPKGKVVHRLHPTDGYTFPAHLREKLLFVTNLRDFPTIRRKLGHGVTAHGVKNGRAQATDYMIHLESLWNLYAIPASLLSNNGSTAAPAEFQADTSYSPADVKKFAAQAGIPDFTTTAEHRVGPFTPSEPDAEASLDFQYMTGVQQSFGAKTPANTPWYWTEADWQYEFVQHIASLPDSGVPSVFSISWGWYEGDQCTVDPGQGPCSGGSGVAQSYAYVAATNAGFKAATARGISIMVSSGDSGAHGRTDGSCSSPMTRPDWPTASDGITAVGATQIDIASGKPISAPKTPYCKNPTAGDCVGSGTEIVCSTATGALIVSGGGFSNVAPQPAWQAAAVKAYLASGAKLPPKADYNATGRGYPDVAAIGHNVLIELSGQITPVDGTSCSSPIFAGLIAVANAQRIANGKATLGFLNPALYQLAANNWNDVVTGDNTCTEDGCTPGCTGYGATKGWDATTGFGTPNFANLLTSLVAL